jgi:formate C-acetyltransferase
MTKMVELALFNGVNRMTGRRVGPATGDPRSFGSMAEFLAAVQRQLEHGARMNVIFNNVLECCYVRTLSMVYHDLMHTGPRTSGIDINAGGCKYNWAGVFGLGLASAAIPWRRSITWCSGASRCPGTPCWRRSSATGGYEAIASNASAPKYGADDDYADSWARRLLDSSSRPMGR